MSCAICFFLDDNYSDRGWCAACELEFQRVFIVHKVGEIMSFNQPQNMSIYQQVKLIHDRLKIHASEGRLGVIAARANMAEGALRAWIESPADMLEKWPSMADLATLQDAMFITESHRE